MLAPEPDKGPVGRYWAISQVGMEMAAPIAVGAGVDYWLGFAPWLTIGGVLIGFIGGMTHLLRLVGRRDDKPPQIREQNES